jgi:hypothetical protein
LLVVKSVFVLFLKALVSHPPLSQFNRRLFTKPTGCHYTKYRFSPDYDWGEPAVSYR